MKTIIIYYSYSGNTKSVMESIHDKTNFDMIALEPVIPYTSNYNTLVNEMENKESIDLTPQIQHLSIDLNTYDAIILGTPVWWYTYPPVINTFLKENDLKNKLIIPVITNGGWIGHTLDDIKKYVNIKYPLNLQFEGNNLVNKKDYDNWLKAIVNKEENYEC